MKSIIYIGMDVHKKTYSLCAFLKELGEIFVKTKFLENKSFFFNFFEKTKN